MMFHCCFGEHFPHDTGVSHGLVPPAPPNPWHLGPCPFPVRLCSCSALSSSAWHAAEASLSDPHSLLGFVCRFVRRPGVLWELPAETARLCGLSGHEESLPGPRPLRSPAGVSPANPPGPGSVRCEGGQTLPSSCTTFRDTPTPSAICPLSPRGPLLGAAPLDFTPPRLGSSPQGQTVHVGVRAEPLFQGLLPCTLSPSGHPSWSRSSLGLGTPLLVSGPSAPPPPSLTS